MRFFTYFFLSLFLSINFAFAQNLNKDKRLKEINLLKSTKSDVEQIFKKKIGFAESLKVKGGRVVFDFSLGKCNESDVSDWDVSKEIVIGISYMPDNQIKLKSLKLNISKYKVERGIGHTPQLWSYSSDDLGIRFKTIDNNEDRNGIVTGIIDEIEYYPSSKFNNLRCKSN